MEFRRVLVRSFKALDAENRLWWGPAGDRTPRLKMFLTEADDGVIATTMWPSGEDFGFNQDGIREIRALGLTFATPTPERLISRILHIGTNAGDHVQVGGCTRREQRGTDV